MVLRIRRRCHVRGSIQHTHGIVIPHQLVSTFFGRLKNAVLNIEQHLQEKQQQQQQLQEKHQQQQPTTDNVTYTHTDTLNSARIARPATRHRYKHVRLPYTNVRRSPRHKPQPV